MAYRFAPEDLEKKADTYFRRLNNFLFKLFMQGSPVHSADLYVQAAHAYSNTNNYTKSGELFYKAGEILMQENNEESVYEASSNFIKSAEAYYIIDKPKSIDAYSKALEITMQRMGDFSMAAILAVKIAKIYKEIKREKEALTYLYRAIEMYGNAQMKINQRNIMGQCAEIELKLRNYEQAFRLYTELSKDDTKISRIIEKTSYQFAAVLCGIILNATSEALEILNEMDEYTDEAKLAFKMLSAKMKKDYPMKDLDGDIKYFKSTNKVSAELCTAIQDAKMIIDPDNDIL